MFVHESNILRKEEEANKTGDAKSLTLLKEVRIEYNKWKNANMSLVGPILKSSKNDKGIIEQRTKLFEQYKEFIEQEKYATGFDSRGNLQSTVLEEFLYYLFKDLVVDISQNSLIGKSHALKDIFFMPSDYHSMLKLPNVRTEQKDHDFVIGVKINTTFQVEGSQKTQKEIFSIPAVAIECKTYIDKTMLEGSSTAAEQLKYKNPNGIYMVVAEWIKLTENINLKKYKVDQIYILRKQKNTDRKYRLVDGYKKNQIHADVVLHLFNTVKTHLTTDWSGGVKNLLVKGYL
jgi:hypothetical protein